MGADSPDRHPSSSIPARELRELVEIEVDAGIEIDEHGNEKRVFATSLDMRRL